MLGAAFVACPRLADAGELGPTGLVESREPERPRAQRVPEGPERPPALEEPADVQGPPLAPRLHLLEEGRVTPAEPEKEPKRHRFFPLPDIAFQSGKGASFGVLLTYAYRRPGVDFNNALVELNAKLTTRGLQKYVLKARLRDLLHKGEAFNFRGEVNADPVFPFVGFDVSKELEGDLIERRFYWVRLLTAGWDALYQHPVYRIEADAYSGQAPGVLSLIVGDRLHYDLFRPIRNTLFAEEISEDKTDTRRGSYVVGVSWDSRDNEWSPTWGSFHDTSFEAAGPWAGGSTSWYRYNLTTRFFRSLGTPSLIFAHMFSMDLAGGAMPLMAQAELGGLRTVEGIGGGWVGRGFQRRRFLAKSKAYTSAELRIQPFSFDIRGRPLTPGLKPFVDVSTILERERNPVENLRVSGGGGLYAVWNEFLVVRFDAGFSDEGSYFWVLTGHAF